VNKYESLKNLDTFLNKRPLQDDSDDDSFNNLRVSTKSCSKNLVNIEEQKNSFDNNESLLKLTKSNKLENSQDCGIFKRGLNTPSIMIESVLNK
jgi:hypothetical protein